VDRGFRSNHPGMAVPLDFCNTWNRPEGVGGIGNAVYTPKWTIPYPPARILRVFLYPKS